MHIKEITSNLRTFVATVRADCGRNKAVVKTSVEAESQTQAKMILCDLYGAGNVLSVTQAIDEQGTKTLSADELRVKSLQDQAKKYKQQAKQVRAQGAVRKAQKQLTAALSSSL